MKHFSLRQLAVLLAGCAVLASASTLVHANEATIQYQVKAGDNLYTLARQQLLRPSDWAAVAKLNKISDPNILQPGSSLAIPVRLLRGQPQTATVQLVRGEVSISAGPNRGKPLAAGQTLREGDVIRAGANGWVGLLLSDGSQLYVSPNSQFGLQKMRAMPQANLRQTDLQLKAGRADFAVQPQTSGSRFEVKTPLAVTGVRGTRFGVATSGQRALTDLVEGKVAINSAQAQAELAPGEGWLREAGQAPSVQALPAAPVWITPPTQIDALPYTLPLPAVSDGDLLVGQLETLDTPPRLLWVERGPKLTLTGPLADGEYRLRVRLQSRNGLQGLEQIQTVKLKTTPQAPLLQAPLAGKPIPTGARSFICAGDEDAKGYLFEISSSKDFLSHTQQHISQGNQCRWDHSLATAGQYYWRVATLEQADSAASRGPFSPVSALQVVPAPVAPEPTLAFADGLTVQWAGEAQQQYQLQIATERSFAQPLIDRTVSEPQAKLDLPLGCIDYFIRLETINQYGMRSGFSKPRKLNLPPVLCSSNGRGIVDANGQPVRLKQ
ncbi:FecR domain-containing protein [Chitinibacter tainanensis]|uniref:FecR domain-containing protein n=1 Tax=Chitinibacter tainanensis TaxID=230667 RepID=UPI00040A14B9|nr:FecR domain-containing protein [Chitinibacter tainanensis]